MSRGQSGWTFIHASIMEPLFFGAWSRRPASGGAAISPEESMGKRTPKRELLVEIREERDALDSLLRQGP